MRTERTWIEVDEAWTVRSDEGELKADMAGWGGASAWGTTRCTLAAARHSLGGCGNVGGGEEE